MVHPAPGNPDGTLVNALLWHCKGSLSGIGGEIRPGIVHRIDKRYQRPAGGGKAIRRIRRSTPRWRHSIHRVSCGGLRQPPGGREALWSSGSVVIRMTAKKPCWRSAAGARYAYTGWRVQGAYGNFTYIACKLKTGAPTRSGYIWHPQGTRWRDAVYGPKKNCIKSLNGQCLHAKELGFVHPENRGSGCSLIPRCRPILLIF